MSELMATFALFGWFVCGAIMCLYTKRWEDFFVWPMIAVKSVYRRAIEVWKQ